MTIEKEFLDRLASTYDEFVKQFFKDGELPSVLSKIKEEEAELIKRKDYLESLEKRNRWIGLLKSELGSSCERETVLKKLLNFEDEQKSKLKTFRKKIVRMRQEQELIRKQEEQNLRSKFGGLQQRMDELHTSEMRNHHRNCRV